MGKILISTIGSFDPHRQKEFSAMHGGHAEAVAEAIAWLADIVMPSAIMQDHKLQDEGACPSNGFGAKKMN